MEFNSQDSQQNLNDENQYTKKSEKKYSFAKGTFIGISVTLLVCLSLLFVGYKNGYINFAEDGVIYVQDTSYTTNDSGIGTKVSDKLNALENALDRFYFDDADESIVESNIYKAYVASFGDKYTTYYTAQEYRDITQSTSGTYCGIGAVVTKNEDGAIKIVQPYENCPAYNAGMRAGDLITKVDGVSVLDRDLNTVVSELKGMENTTVNIEVVREGSEKTFTVERRKIEIPTIKHEMLEGKIGYITILEFDQVTEAQFISAYNELKSQGMKGLMIDVRSNPGGLLTTVINILDELLPDGLIVYVDDKDGNRQEYRGKNSNQIDIPMVVLVNEDSASASEIFAGAIQDYGIGTIVGTQTFGKGIVQSIRPLTDGSAIKMTIAKYFTPKGQDIHGEGVTPDVSVQIESGKSYLLVPEEEDTQYQKGLQILKEKIAK